MARANYVTKARKAIPSAGIEVGDSYYWWKFRYGGKHYSKTRPRASQLTQSAFKGAVYDLNDSIAAASADDSLQGFKDEVLSTLEDLRSECESSLENIPESLKYAASGELLQERIDMLEAAISEVEDIDVDDEPTEADEGEELEDIQQQYWDDALDAFGNLSIEA